MMEDDDLAEMQALRNTESYKKYEDMIGGPQKKAKYEESDDADAPHLSDAPIGFGSSNQKDEGIVSVRTVRDSGEESDSGDEFGPMPPSAPAQGDQDGTSSPPSMAPASSFLDNYRKRMIVPLAKKENVEAKPKKADGWYVFGQDEIPDASAESPSAYEERVKQMNDAAPTGDFDMDVLMDDDTAKYLPIRYEAYLRAHTKPISALALDPAGVRLVSAGADFQLRFWDFSSMDRSLQPFRAMQPMESNLIHTLEWSRAGDKILMAANTPQVQILDREGRKQLETPRGYQYTTDMTHTTGHINPVTRAVWHPTSPSSFASCGHDATVRFWNMEEMKKHNALIKLKTERGLSTCKALCLTFDATGKTVAVALDDGSIQLFPSNGPYLKPSLRLSNAHVVGTDTSDLAYAPGDQDGVMLLSRGGDDTLKVWDLRKPNAPLTIFPALLNRFPQTKMTFNDSGNIVATGTSNSREGDPGSIFFFDLRKLQLLKIVDVSTESIIALRWSKATNQILAGCGNGVISTLFDPDISQRGVLTALSKSLRKVSTQKSSDIDIITPFAPQELNERQRKAAARKDPAASHKPLQPVSGRGSQGLLGSNLKADIMKKLMTGKSNVDEDPREALLRHASASPSSASSSILDYEGLERLNEAEKERAEALERARKSAERK